MKLISMTDFVLSQTTPDLLELCEFEDNSRKIYKYANFLKQPLRLGMFIPCDDDGNVLEEPKLFKDYSKPITKTTSVKGSDIIDCEEYQKAQSKVLFNGFEIAYTKEENPCQFLYNDEAGINVFLDKSFGVRHETIEDLAGLDLAVSF